MLMSEILTNSTDTHSPLQTERAWQLLERVSLATQFRRSTRLRDLLFYLGQQSLYEDSPRLLEQQIGEKVFGRPTGYDTSQDNIVRVNMTELRKRVELFFAQEGMDESLLFEIPRGSYRLVFRTRQPDPFDKLLEQERPGDVPVANHEPLPTSASISTVPLETTPRSRLSLGLAVAIGLLLLVVVGLLVRVHRLETRLHPWASQNAVRLFWKPFLAEGKRTDVVLADTSFALAQDMTRQQLSLNDYLNYRYQQAQGSGPTTPEAREQERRDLQFVLGRNSGSIGDFRVALRVASLDEAGETKISSSRDYSADALRRNTSILLGSPRSNPWVELFTDKLAYKFGVSPDRTEALILVEHPQAGEQSQYSSLSDPGTKVGYCVIALLPNLSGGGDTLIIAGTDSQATEAAGEFLTSDAALQEVLRKLRRNDFGHFQLLLRTARLNGTPLGAEVISIRLMAN